MAGRTFHPLTPDRWDDLADLFGPHGACAGCWCTYWRQPTARIRVAFTDENRAAFKAIVDRNEQPGILGYQDDRAVAWCAVAPRRTFPRLTAGRFLLGPDAPGVWAITCFYIRRGHRRQGWMRACIAAARDVAAPRGAAVVEAYPSPPTPGSGAAALYMGLPQAFTAAGFREIGRSRRGRPTLSLGLVQPPAAGGDRSRSI